MPSGERHAAHRPRWASDGTSLRAAPYEAVFLPQDISQSNSCPTNGASPTDPWRAIVTFPSCNLVALVELPSGNIVSSGKARRTVDAKADRRSRSRSRPRPRRPARHECGDGRAAAATDGSAPIPMPARRTCRRRGRRRSRICAGGDARLRLVRQRGRDPSCRSVAGGADGRASRRASPLHEGAQGSNRIRLGVDPYTASRHRPRPSRDSSWVTTKIAPTSTSSPVTARCGSSTCFNPGWETECETNFDALDRSCPDPGSRAMVAVDAGQRCIPYGSVKRRPYSRDTAGLRFPTFPVDVAAADMGRVTGGDAPRGHRRRRLCLGADRERADLPRQHRPGSALDQGGRPHRPDSAVRSDRASRLTRRSVRLQE